VVTDRSEVDFIRNVIHPTTFVELAGRRTYIDLDLSGVIRSLWALRISTLACC